MLLAVLPEILGVVNPVHVLHGGHAWGQRSVDLWNLIALRARQVIVSAKSI